MNFHAVRNCKHKFVHKCNHQSVERAPRLMHPSKRMRWYQTSKHDALFRTTPFSARLLSDLLCLEKTLRAVQQQREAAAAACRPRCFATRCAPMCRVHALARMRSLAPTQLGISLLPRATHAV